jgi:hypothetical protein
MGKNAAKPGKTKNRGVGDNSALVPEWMDLQGLTQYADVSERTFRAWIHSAIDPLPASRIGGKILVNRHSFDAWLRAHPLKPANSIDLDATVEDVLADVTRR